MNPRDRAKKLSQAAKAAREERLKPPSNGVPKYVGYDAVYGGAVLRYPNGGETVASGGYQTNGIFAEGQRIRYSGGGDARASQVDTVHRIKPKVPPEPVEQPIEYGYAAIVVVYRDRPVTENPNDINTDQGADVYLVVNDKPTFLATVQPGFIVDSLPNGSTLSSNGSTIYGSIGWSIGDNTTIGRYYLLYWQYKSTLSKIVDYTIDSVNYTFSEVNFNDPEFIPRQSKDAFTTIVGSLTGGHEVLRYPGCFSSGRQRNLDLKTKKAMYFLRDSADPRPQILQLANEASGSRLLVPETAIDATALISTYTQEDFIFGESSPSCQLGSPTPVKIKINPFALQDRSSEPFQDAPEWRTDIQIIIPYQKRP